MKIYLVNIFLFSRLLCYAQIAGCIPSSYCGGGVSVAQKGVWQSFYNPALLATLDRKSISVVCENRFAMKELSVPSAALAIPARLLSVGLSVSHFGFSDYSEMLAGLSFAHKFDEYLTLGIQFDYYSAKFSHSFGSKGAVVSQVGILSSVTPDLSVGFCAFNPTRQRVQYLDVVKKIPSLFSLGIQYRFLDTFHVACQLDDAPDRGLEWRNGFEYQLSLALVVRLGFYGLPFVPTLGCGVSMGNFLLDVGFAHHPVLGITSVGALHYNF